MALLIPLMKAQLLATESRFGEALEIFNNVLEQSSPENLDRRKACFYADRAWCRLKLNQPNLALADIDIARHHATIPADSDDLAVAHARIAEILDQLGQRERSIEHKNLSLSFRRRHLDAQAELLGQLQQAFPGPPAP
jgi:tetratricopeptide (TPR) repeat protein